MIRTNRISRFSSEILMPVTRGFPATQLTQENYAANATNAADARVKLQG